MIPNIFSYQVVNENLPQQAGQQITNTVQQIQPLQIFNEQLFYLVAIGVIAFLSFIFLRIYKNYSSYAGHGNVIGRMKMIMQNGERWTFNVSEMEGFDSDLFNALRNTTDFSGDKETINRLEKLSEEKKLFAYDVKVTEWKEARDLRGKSNGILLSSAPIDDKLYSAKDRDGYVTINSFPNKEYPRVFTVHKDSKVVEKQNVLTGEIIPIWVVAPVPSPDKATAVQFGLPQVQDVDLFKEDGFDPQAYVLKVELLPNIEQFGDLVLHMKTFIKMHTLLNAKNIEIAKLVDLMEEKDKESIRLQLKVDEANTVSNSEPLEGERPKPPKPEKPFPFGWVAGCGLMGIVGALLPTYVPQMNGFPPLFSGGLAVIIFMVVAYYMNKPDTQVPSERLELKQ